MEAADANPSNVQVQHVTKKSSDELLRKFAELEGDDDDKGPARKELRVAVKRRKRSTGAALRRREGDYSQCESPSGNGSTSLAERKWLLPPAARRRSALLRQLGIGRSQIRATEIRNSSLFGTIEKTWRKTIEGASKVFMEKHYNRHRRLVNDVV
ncbi:uncharacterized protein LOC110415587 [Herrania umbratica]|uniref:Uncharacterized protein LOC110415587 n=1 Tax=Herrania umbratica TaxID=108875 RepID=A0A6J1A888_9ROSI|nr:uncharacterized protein LOC110415587 [Herrania umbratica]